MFILRGYKRCGTEMLRTALDSHSKIKCHGELLSSKYQEQIAEMGLVRYLRSHKLLATDGFVVHSGPGDGDQTVQQAIRQLWDSAAITSTPVIAIERRDIIRLAASDVIAKTTGVSHVYLHEKPSKTQHTLVMTPPQLVRAADAAQRAFEATSVLCPWAHVVIYEDIIRDWDNHMEEMQDYLGVPHELIGGMTRRQEVRKIRDIVYNYEDLKATLYDTRPELFDIAEQYDDEPFD